MPTPHNFITEGRALVTAQPAVLKGEIANFGALGPRPPSLSVERAEPKRTACGWGMSPDEVKRVTATMLFLRGTRLPCYYAVLGDHLLDFPEARARSIFSK